MQSLRSMGGLPFFYSTVILQGLADGSGSVVNIKIIYIYIYIYIYIQSKE